MTDLSERVLVLSAGQRDAESTCLILSQAGISSFKCHSAEHLEDEIGKGAGALILAKEALTPNSIERLAHLLNAQPTWSFLPIIFLVSPGDFALDSSTTLRFLQPLRNTTFLERPVRVGTLVSVIQASLADRKRQYEVRDLLMALEKSKQEAIEASQAKSSFLANMSHEIRTPLGAVLGFSELLMEPSIAKREKHAYMTTIRRNGQLLSALIDDILDLAKVESGHIDIEAIDISINELVSEVVSALEPKASAKNIPLSVSWAPEVPRIVKTDPVRLKQIMINVVGNAIKFTQKGNVSVHLASSPVIEGRQDSMLRITVTDTGLGISTVQAQHLFQPFTQADSSITRKFGGTGLGLVLSKNLAQALGGDLVLKRSEPGQGSTFEITIGVQVPSDRANIVTAPRADRMPVIQTGPRPLMNYRILLVDDSKDNQVLIGRILRLDGADVQTANDGIEGIERALSEDFDIVLMDIQMPRLGGQEATLHLRRKGFTKPVIALTAHALKEDRERCLAAGCSDYLTKPVQRTELIQTVLNYIQSPSGLH